MVDIFLKKHNGELIKNLKVSDLPDVLKKDKDLVWVDIESSDPKEIGQVLDVFEAHPLTIEDCTMSSVRPKIEKFSNYLFLILHAVNYEQERKKVRLLELDFCLGKNFLVTVHAKPIPSIIRNKDQAVKDHKNMNKGTDFLLYSLIDALVDRYLPLLTQLDRKLDQLEDELSEEPTQKILDQLYDLKKDVGYLRRTLGPQRDILKLISRGGYSLIKETHYHHFRDIYDNLVRLGDLIDTSRDAVADILDVHASVAFNRFNETIKVLTIIATIMMPLTLITGIYGMNFRHMPEIGSKFGYAGVWIAMLLITIGMLAFFKRRKWL